jgi:hypothetical protein
MILIKSEKGETENTFKMSPKVKDMEIINTLLLLALIVLINGLPMEYIETSSCAWFFCIVTSSAILCGVLLVEVLTLYYRQYRKYHFSIRKNVQDMVHSISYLENTLR